LSQARAIFNVTRASCLCPRLAAAVVLFLFASHCLAQTTAPAIAPPPAVEGAYEHDSLRHNGVAASASTPGKTGTAPQFEPSSTFDVRRVVTALAIVLGLVFACRWGARWMFPTAAVGRSSQIMKVLSRSVIAPRQQLLLIQVGRRLVLVGDCGQQMSALAEISDPDEVASLLGQLRAEPPPIESSNPFAPLLGRAQRQFDDLNVPPAVDPDEEEPEFAVAGVDETRGDLSGLTEKIRMLSKQLGEM
jgi:flagellar biogenesis protein FliO